jgi:hypothetical protein
MPAIALCGAVVPVAQLSSRADNPGDQTILIWLVVGIGLAVLLLTGGYLAARLARRRGSHSHAALFKQLCRIHHLDRASRALLRRIAAQYRIAQPARLFVDPRWLDSASRSATPPGSREHLSVLQNRLFGDSDE